MRTPDYVVTYSKTPSYLTPGKHYPPIEDFDDGALYGILDNDDDPIIIRVPECAHLGFTSWKKGYTFHV